MNAIQHDGTRIDWHQKAHDIKNIVATISMVADELGAGASTRGQTLSQRLERSCARVLEICMDNPAECGDEDGSHSLKQVLTDVATLADGLVGEETQIIVFSEETSLGEQTGAAVFRILANLATNAVGALSGQAQGRITIQGTVREGHVQITLMDNGPGMQSKVSQDAPGLPQRTGMGLSIARTLADRIGGHLSMVRSGPDGTIFRLTFPASGPDQADQSATGFCNAARI